MDRCRDCKYFENYNTYRDAGWCYLNKDYVDEDDTCEDYKEGD